MRSLLMVACLAAVGLGQDVQIQPIVPKPQGDKRRFEQTPDTDRVFGEHFSSHLPRLMAGMRQLSNKAIRFLLSDRDLQKELKLTEQQLESLESVMRQETQGREIFRSILGSDHPGKVGRLNERELNDVIEKAKPMIRASNEKIEAGIRGVLTKSQQRRFEQIYRQHLLLSRKVTPDGTGFGWDDVTAEQQQAFRQMYIEADKEIAKAIRQLRWNAYRDRAAEIVAKDADDLLGEPFRIDFIIKGMRPAGTKPQENVRRPRSRRPQSSSD